MSPEQILGPLKALADENRLKLVALLLSHNLCVGALAKRLEREAGRRGDARWGPRTLDVDILLLGDAVIDLPGLVIPHASMAYRRFCLLPAAEVAPAAVVPTYGRTVTQLLDSCEDPLEVIVL